MLESEQVLESEWVYTGSHVSVRRDRVRLSNGAVGIREVVESAKSIDAACIVALDGEKNVLLVRQYRLAAGKVLLEVPAGGLEPGESPEACAQRELREETGFSAAHLEMLGTFWTAPGFAAERMHVFLATSLKLNPLPPDEDERLELEKLPLAEAVVMARDGRFQDGKSIAAVLMAEHRIVEFGLKTR